MEVLYQNHPMIKKIIITGDVLRPSCHENGVFAGNQDFNINNRYLLFSHLFKTITDLEVEKCYWNSKESFDTPYFYQLLNCPLENELSWFAVYNKENLSEIAENYLLKFFQNTFVIGFELPPILCNFFIKYNIPYVKLIDYPIRFLDDTIAGVSTNISDIFSVIKTFQMEEEGFYIHAGLAKIRLQGSNILEKGAAIFFGQTQFDASMYKDGKCLNVLDFKDEIETIAKNHKKLYFKKHPYAEPPNETLATFLDKLNVEYIEHNAYELLANENLMTVVSISSSVLEEAKYFQKNAICLYKLPYNYAKNNRDEKFNYSIHVPIGAYIFFPNFWLNIFKCLNLSKKNNFNDTLSFEANTCRFSITGFWGYDKLYKPDRLINPVRHEYRTMIKDFQNEINECQKLNHVLIGKINEINDMNSLLESKMEEMNKKIEENFDAFNFQFKEFNFFREKLYRNKISKKLSFLFSKIKQLQKCIFCQ